MKISTKNNKEIIISLTDKEVDIIFGGYKSIIPISNQGKIAIEEFLANVIERQKIPFYSNKGLIKVKQHLNGCTITLTKIISKAAKSGKRTAFSGAVAEFERFEELITALKSLKGADIKIFKSDLYCISQKYTLIIYSKYSVEFLGNFLGKSLGNVVKISYIKEYGTPLCQGNAIEYLDEIFN